MRMKLTTFFYDLKVTLCFVMFLMSKLKKQFYRSDIRTVRISLLHPSKIAVR